MLFRELHRLPELNVLDCLHAAAFPAFIHIDTTTAAAAATYVFLSCMAQRTYTTTNIRLYIYGCLS